MNIGQGRGSNRTEDKGGQEDRTGQDDRTGQEDRAEDRTDHSKMTGQDMQCCMKKMLQLQDGSGDSE
jgi:hypothetical protein